MSSSFGGFGRHAYAREVRLYMRGNCGYLALALHRQMEGSQIWNLAGYHFAVEDAQGAFWDVRGRMTLEQLWLSIQGETMVPVDQAGVIAEIDRGVYGDGVFSPSHARRARAWLKEIGLPHLSPVSPRSPRPF